MKDHLAPQYRYELAAWLRANRRALGLAIFENCLKCTHVFISRLPVAPFVMQSTGKPTEFILAEIERE